MTTSLRGAQYRDALPVAEHVLTQAPLPSRASRATERGRKCVLLVEDDDAVRALLVSVLQGRGYFVLQARDGDEALRQAERCRRKIRLIVTDVVMPGWSGPALVSRLAERMPLPRVLYISGYTKDVPPNESGAGFMQKPFTPRAFALRVQELLDA